MVMDVIKSFKPFKVAGPNMVFPALIQKEEDYISSNLAGTFNTCLKRAYIRSSWREASVVFIAKTGKASYAMSTFYRSISLTSFLHKTMEHTIDTMNDKARYKTIFLNIINMHFFKKRLVGTAVR